MPVKSKAQARFMWAIAKGEIKKRGLSKAIAKEFVQGVPVKGLKERVSKKKRSKRRGKKS